MNAELLMAKISSRFPYFALRKLAKQYEAEYGSVVNIGGKAWAQLSDKRLPNYLAWALKRFRYSSVLLCCQVENKCLVLAWHKQDAICNQFIGFEHLPHLLGCFVDIDGFVPKVFYFFYQENGLTLLPDDWSDREEIGDWPQLTKSIPQLQQLMNTGKKPLTLVFAITASILLTVIIWPTGNNLEPEPIPPAETSIQEILAGSPGAVAPLLQLDGQIQRLLYQLPGWEVALVEYHQNSLRYRMIRNTGRLSELRRFADRLNTRVMVQGEEIWLQRLVALPPALDNSTELDKLPQLTQLEDHLNDSIQILIPASGIQFQAVEHKAEWGVRRAQITLNGHFHEDLLTLSSLLDGLPVRLVDVSYRVTNNQLHGYVSIDIYGVHNG